MNLPRNMESRCFVPESADVSAVNIETQEHRVDWEYPESELYKVLKLCCEPDPPNYHIARFKDWIHYINPGLFQEGTIKEAIKEKIYYFAQDREKILKAYCKRNHTKLSSFQPFEPVEIQGAKYASFGPTPKRIDTIDRWLRKADLHLPFSIRAGVVIALILLLLILNLFDVAPLQVQLKFLSFAVFIMAILELPIQYLGLKSALRRVTQVPIICPIYTIRLHNLLRDLNELGKGNIPNIMAGIFKMPELKNSETVFHRSRLHPDKKAYSISLETKVVIKPKILPALFREETLSVKIEIVGESVRGPHIVFVWFEPPRSIILAKLSLKIINLITDELSRILCCRLDFQTKFISMHKHRHLDNEKILLEYWPLLFKRYHISTDSRAVKYRRKHCAIRTDMETPCKDDCYFCFEF